ncbi:hypothetical protein ColLi_07975 [Colletotrichum liriopes]|uniref:Uncharacterized protein n=1 Tax=Colletotrichum liriopes TaxID=708192 RepID=A0AA37LUP4_9PEZI|nr:hypothetical protein ColLi_07975 [Colletotrichum liriopes]
MSVLLYIQQELMKTHIPEDGFKGLRKGDNPCTNCVGSLYRHVFLKCCSSEVNELCVVCKVEGKECRAIPEELLGVAQSLWNHAKDIASKHLDKDKVLNDLQRWRVHSALQRACIAWNELLEFVDQPIDLGDASPEAVRTQEAIISREMSIIRLLRDADIIRTPEELRARLAALAPPWSRHVEPARKLREAVAAIPLAKNVPAPGVAEERGFSEFPQLVPAEVTEKLIQFSRNAVPACWLRYPGARLRICEGGEGEKQGLRRSADENATAETREGTNEPTGPEGGDLQHKAGEERPVRPDHEHDPGPEPESDPEPEPPQETGCNENSHPSPVQPLPSAPAAGHDEDSDAAEPPKAPTKPKRGRPADRNPAKKAATAKKAPVPLATARGGKAAAKSNKTAKSGETSTRNGDEEQDDNYANNDGDDDAEGEEDKKEAKTGPVTRSQLKRTAPDEEPDQDEGKMRKRARVQRKAAAGK